MAKNSARLLRMNISTPFEEQWQSLLKLVERRGDLQSAAYALRLSQAQVRRHLQSNAEAFGELQAARAEYRRNKIASLIHSLDAGKSLALACMAERVKISTARIWADQVPALWAAIWLSENRDARQEMTESVVRDLVGVSS